MKIKIKEKKTTISLGSKGQKFNLTLIIYFFSAIIGLIEGGLIP